MSQQKVLSGVLVLALLGTGWKLLSAPRRPTLINEFEVSVDDREEAGSQSRAAEEPPPALPPAAPLAPLPNQVPDFADARAKAQAMSTALDKKDHEVAVFMEKKMKELASSPAAARKAMKEFEICVTQPPAGANSMIQIFCVAWAQKLAQKHPSLSGPWERILKAASPETVKMAREMVIAGGP